MRKFLFQCGHRYYRDTDGRVFLTDDSTHVDDAVEVDTKSMVFAGHSHYAVPLAAGGWVTVSCDEAAACVSHFRMGLRLGRGQWAINMTAGG